MKKVEVKNREGAVIFECLISSKVESGFAVRHALEKAIAVRPRINLINANLSGANLSGAYLINADLSGANLYDSI